MLDQDNFCLRSLSILFTCLSGNVWILQGENINHFWELKGWIRRIFCLGFLIKVTCMSILLFFFFFFNLVFLNQTKLNSSFSTKFYILSIYLNLLVIAITDLFKDFFVLVIARNCAAVWQHINLTWPCWCSIRCRDWDW